jgi:hypothetical protein
LTKIQTNFAFAPFDFGIYLDKFSVVFDRRFGIDVKKQTSSAENAFVCAPPFCTEKFPREKKGKAFFSNKFVHNQ